MSSSGDGVARIVAPPRAASIVAIAAHPDDIESWCAGTLARAAAHGARVRLLLVTSGEKGTSDAAADPSAVAARREAEATRAADILGITEVVFLRYPDAELEETATLRRDLVAWIRRWRPDVIFTHDPVRPWPAYLSHRDHRIVGRAVLDAIYPLARDPLNFAEHVSAGLRPHVVREAWLFASAGAECFVDIADAFQCKLAARLAHASQTTDPDMLCDGWRERAARIGAPVGFELAEAFTIVQSD
jgi:LmbE family N-acetylglucosaminyl deacetylase